MHVGNLRTALYTYLQARHNGGTFILRIEDTDQGRLVEGATDIIYNTLRATGLTWDEGPDIGGPVGPYVQSERMGMFKQYAEQLVAEGKAYYCFCTKEELAERRAAERDMRAGRPRSEALRDLAARLDMAAITNFISTLIQAEATGMSLGPILRAQAEQRRTERFARAEKLAMQAPVKLLFPLLFFIFPCVFAILMFPIVMKFMGAGL